MIRQTTIYRLNSIQLITRRHLSTPMLKQNISKRNNNKFRRYVVYPTAILATGLGGVYWIDKHYYSSVITRSTRAVYILLWIAYQYGFNSHAYSDLNELHEIASDKLMHLLVTNKGIFIKLGQAIANQGRLFPEAYQRKFPMMYDQAPVQSWEHVDRVLKQSLGEDYEGNVFEIINHEPIASASVAQVHYGKLKSGEEVAVKVQHDYISRQLPADLWVYRFISRVYEKVFDIPLSMFTKYVSEKVIEETNFKHEMNNSERLQGLIKDDPSIDNEVIYIPKNFPEFTTEKVLTAEWIGGTPLTHKEILLEKNYDLVGIMNKYIKLFGAQIFKYGFIHSDPHPGNLMVRYLKNGKQQLVLLDHGLYIELPDSFRVEYCNLWRYLFLLDKDGIEEIGKKWGISSLDLFATVVQLRPVLLHPEDTNGEHPDNRNVSDLFRDFIGDKKKFPAELPFLARTMRMIQNLNQSFGSPVNRINLLTKDLVDALLHERHISFVDYWSLIKIRVVLTFSDLMFYFVRIRQYFIGDRYGGKGKGLEDYIEMYMQNTAKSLGMEWI